MEKSLNDSRLELHEKLVNVLGSRNVYFQPPETVRMKYPAIVYELYRVYQRFADNYSYKKAHGYSVTIIDPDNGIDWIDKMLDSFPYCALERVYIADNINHYSFILYY